MEERGQGRILIVDDEDDLRVTLQDRLALQGYETTVCGTGEEALEALKTEPFDVLLTDLMMPGMSGLDLLRVGLEIDPHLVCILMTGQATVPTAVEALKAGAFDYITKPFKVAALRPVLSRAIELRQLRTKNVHLQETVAIHELSQAVAFVLDWDAILEKIVDAAAQQCGAVEVSVMLPTDDGALSIAAVRGEHRTGLVGERVPIAGSISGWVAEHLEPVMLHADTDDPRFPGAAGRPGTTSVSVPMLTGGRLVGVLNVNAAGRSRPFTPGQIKALTILAGTGAAALENARLYEHVSERERRFRGTFQQAAVGMAHVTPDGKWLRVNPTLCEMLGYTERELLPLTMREVTHPSDLHPKLELLQKVATSELPGFQIEERSVRKDGTHIWTHLTVSAVYGAMGRPEFLVGVWKDVTARKEAELEQHETNRRLTEALEDLQRAQSRLIEQERLRALGQMASGIAHDFNNALAPILGFTELLLYAPGTLNDRENIQSYLEMINTAARDAASVVHRLREFYREREEIEEFHPVKLPALVEQAVSLTQPKWQRLALADGRRIQVKTQLDAVPSVLGDPAQLRELLTNLVFNAVDAMPDGGMITLRTYRQHDRAVLEVRDTGTGMTEEVRRRCLEPFFTTKGKEGTGLGLPMVYGIVQRHGGTIAIETQPGQGTAFVVSLPTEPAGQTTAPAREPGRVSAGQPLRVLVVDDEPAVQQVTATFLTADGHRVETAGSGTEALAKFQPETFDLVITDQAMPGMSGDQFAAAIRERAPAQRILMLTGFAALMQARGELPAGVDRLLGKPVTLAGLREAVADLTALQRLGE